MIRITSGKNKNVFLEVPEEISKPLTDMMRISIFDTLQPYLQDAVVLDAYAGSGVTGLEALSRGAKKAIFVDSNNKACNIIRANISKCGDTLNTEVIEDSVIKYLKKSKDVFDIIFLDPPFDQTFKIDINKLYSNTHEDSIIVLRASLYFYRRNRNKIIDTDFTEKYSKVFGQSIVVFYRR